MYKRNRHKLEATKHSNKVRSLISFFIRSYIKCKGGKVAYTITNLKDVTRCTTLALDHSLRLLKEEQNDSN